MLHRFVLALSFAALLGGVSAAAQVESLTQMSLAQSARFRTRLVYVFLQTARVIKAEPLGTLCHTRRSIYADVVIANAADAVATAAAMIVGGGQTIGRVVTNADPSLVDTAATDGDLLAQVNEFWNALSKCDTGS